MCRLQVDMSDIYPTVSLPHSKSCPQIMRKYYRDTKVTVFTAPAVPLLPRKGFAYSLTTLIKFRL